VGRAPVDSLLQVLSGTRASDDLHACVPRPSSALAPGPSWGTGGAAGERAHRPQSKAPPVGHRPQAAAPRHIPLFLSLLLLVLLLLLLSLLFLLLLLSSSSSSLSPPGSSPTGSPPLRRACSGCTPPCASRSATATSPCCSPRRRRRAMWRPWCGTPTFWRRRAGGLAPAQGARVAEEGRAPRTPGTLRRAPVRALCSQPCIASIKYSTVQYRPRSVRQ